MESFPLSMLLYIFSSKEWCKPHSNLCESKIFNENISNIDNFQISNSKLSSNLQWFAFILDNVAQIRMYLKWLENALMTCSALSCIGRSPYLCLLCSFCVMLLLLLRFRKEFAHQLSKVISGREQIQIRVPSKSNK